VWIYGDAIDENTQNDDSIVINDAGSNWAHTDYEMNHSPAVKATALVGCGRSAATCTIRYNSAVEHLTLNMQNQASGACAELDIYEVPLGLDAVVGTGAMHDSIDVRSTNPGHPVHIRPSAGNDDIILGLDGNGNYGFAEVVLDYDGATPIDLGDLTIGPLAKVKLAPGWARTDTEI